MLNATARDVYLLCVEHGDAEAVVAILCERYDADASRIAEDVRSAVRRLVDLGLLRDDGNGGPPPRT